MSGHIDVVPVDGQNWSSNPFRLSARAGRLYASISSVVCGPGSIERAHRADEYISIAQFAAGQRFMANLGRMCSSP